MKIHSRYFDEFAVILQYYSVRNLLAAEKFAREAEAALDRIEKFPLAGKSVRGEYRAMPVKGFPYVIHYFVEEAGAGYVVYIYHCKRKALPNWPVK